jgi:DNA-binding transcriptional regulator GbsR (MarR family)
MELDEGKEKFIQAWGTLGSKWGINRTMAQVQALLLISAEPLSAEEIMAALNISRGNANMNLRALMDWGVVFKELKPGERKEFFVAEKDVWSIAKQVVIERRKRELEPVLKVLKEISEVEGEQGDAAVAEFKKVTTDIEEFANKVNTSFDRMVKADEHWFFGPFMKLMR